MQKKNERAQQVNIPACISCYLGVTEPALFGVNMKYGFPLVCGMIGSGLAAVISIVTGSEAYSIGVGGLPGILSIKPQFYLTFLLAMAVAIVVPFVLTLIVGKRKLDAAALGTDQTAAPAPIQEMPSETSHELKAPLSGYVIPMEQIPDQVFSQGVLGQGVGIEPTGNVVVAPADATVSTVIEDSKHACGLLLDNGVALLIHVGMDTVTMGGDGFQLHVKEGDRVHAGDKLITFDPEKIRAAGHPTTTAFVITEPGSVHFNFHTGLDAQAGETAIITME